jgi:hypothetical protein
VLKERRKTGRNWTDLARFRKQPDNCAIAQQKLIDNGILVEWNVLRQNGGISLRETRWTPPSHAERVPSGFHASATEVKTATERNDPIRLAQDSGQIDR